MSDLLYPPGPAQVPSDLTQATPSYRRHAWFAMLGLALFVLLYLAMLSWLCWTAYRQFSTIQITENMLGTALVGGCAAFLAIFMAKALFFIKRGSHSEDLEISAAEHPHLFAFLHRLADEAGAPKPHRVFVSARVNAAVFYDISLVNLLLPAKKNLEIGLGLVNVLNLGEFKAVLAHEFGHFAQRTMAVGRWVYTAQQVAAHIIAQRDALDRFLIGLSSTDLRIAWIGWMLRLIIWAIRSLVELLFRVVILAQRALSREMEYQADLVAVSLTGSDALVHALHKLNAADEAWDSAMRFAAGELQNGRQVQDLCVLQLRLIEQLRVIRADAEFGSSPNIPVSNRAEHRVFKANLAQPPMMWATHPANTDREANAKRVYIEAAIDQRSAFELFSNCEALKHQITQNWLSELREDKQEVQFVPNHDSVQRLDESFARPALDRRFRGAYLDRKSTLLAVNSAELYAQDLSPISNREQANQAIAALYPEEYGQTLEAIRELTDEFQNLQAIQLGFAKANTAQQTSGGMLRWRGTDVRRKELPKVLQSIDQEIRGLDAKALRFEQQARSTYRMAAKALGQEWVDALESRARLLHFVEHTQADLIDANGVLRNTYEVVTADGSVSSGERKRLVTAANNYFNLMAPAYQHAAMLLQNSELMKLCEFDENLEPLRLGLCSEENIGDWLNAINGWNGVLLGSYSRLSRVVLDSLLATEAKIAEIMHSGVRETAPFVMPAAPAEYPSFTRGSERPLQRKLGWWDRFMVAEGVVASGARFGVAASIVGAVLYFGSTIGGKGEQTIHIYNGLATAVRVEIEGQKVELPPVGSNTVLLATELPNVQITAHTQDQLIESMRPSLDANAKHFVYNVAQAAALVQWTATYGSVEAADPHFMGAQSFAQLPNLDHYFTDPPESISTKGGGGVRSVLSAVANSPQDALEIIQSEEQKKQLVIAHVSYDDTRSEHYQAWVASAKKLDRESLAPVIAKRLQGDAKNEILRSIQKELRN